MSGAVLPLPRHAFMAWCSVKKSTGTSLLTFTLLNNCYERGIRVCIQKFPDWPLGARTASSLPLGAVVSVFCESV
jgi:hypothetical protein